MKKLIILLFTFFLSVGSLSAQSTDPKKLIQLANQGDVNAQHNLGVMYNIGRGVPQDYAQAAKWYRLAADQGYAPAQYFLAAMYRNGEGVPQDYGQAVKWSRLAADQGHANAKIILGLMYEDGQGVPQDNVLAHMWFNLAAAQGDPNGKRYRDLVAEKMTPQQIAQAQELARNWKINTTSTSSQSKNQFSTPLKKGASMAVVITISQVLAVMAAFFSTWSLMKRFDKTKAITKISLTLLGGLTAFFVNIISLGLLDGLGLYDDKWTFDAQMRAAVPPLYFGLFISWMAMRENSWVVGYFKKIFPKLVN
jgi:hypothetical protein